MSRPPIPIEAGTRFGKLVVIRDRKGKERQLWVACDCGSEPKLAPLSELRRRRNPLRSCGCGIEAGWANLQHGTSMPGERNPGAKLTARRVRAIRRRLASGEPVRKVAKRYGISQSQVRRIAHRESWGDLR